MTASLTFREAEPVAIGSYTLYCERFSASAARDISETSTVTGNGIITGDGQRASRLTFSGRVCDENEPLSFLRYIGNMIRGSTSINIEYRGIVFSGCRLQKYEVEDNGDDSINASVTFITENIFSEAEE
jgi:hypothetical protein